MWTKSIRILKNIFLKIVYHVKTIQNVFIVRLHALLLFVWQCYFLKTVENEEDGFYPHINSNT